MTDTDRTQQRKPLMDYTTLTADDAPAVSRASGGDRFAKLEGTPFAGWLTETKDNDHAKTVTVPDQATAKQVAYMLRLAAQQVGCGVRIPNTDGVYPSDKSGVKVTFQGTARRQYDGHRKPVQRKAETSVEFDTRVKEWETVTGRSYND